MNKVAMVSQDSYNYEQVRSRMKEMIGLLGGMGNFIKPGDRVLIKPNLLSASKPSKRITTDPVIVKAAASLVLEAGGGPFIGDSPALEPFPKVSRDTGMELVGRELGIPVKELTGPVKVETGPGFRFRNIEISSQVLDADAVINIPKLKTHCQMLLTLGVKNLFGTVVAQRKAEWHYRVGLDRDLFASLHLDIYKAIRPTLTILDGIWGMEGHGPGNGNPRHFGLMAASGDALSLDMAICRYLDIDPDNFPLYRAAKARGFNELIEGAVIVGDMDPQDHPAEVNIPRLDSLHVLPGFLKLLGPWLVSRPYQDKALCIGCGRCVDICAAKALELSPDRTLHYDYKKCIRCFCCQEVCPRNAIKFRKGLLQKVMELFHR
ncbi:MAG: DUF362 domain-containing protein [Synergistales bacterium]|nr:DUF362 domain-containing protein [Synergistales bacterium]